MAGTDVRSTGDRVLSGRYRLLRQLESGPPTELWEGRDDVLARPVTVRLIRPPSADPTEGGRAFLAEAAAAARIAHSGVVRTFDTGVDVDPEPVAYAVLERARGRRLDDVIERDGPLPIGLALEVVRQVAGTLAHLHDVGVRGCLTPRCVLIADDHTGALHAKLDVFASQADTVLRAPERGADGAATPASDVFSLGALLVVLATGLPPRRHADAFGVEPGFALPPSVEPVLRRALAVNPEHRYASPVDFASALPDLTPDANGGHLTPPDDAAPVFERDPTPAAGIAAVRRRPPRRWPALVALGVAIAAVAGLVAALAPRTDDAATPAPARTPPTSSIAATPLAITSTRTYDTRDGSENDDRLPRLRDGRLDTAWATDGYATRRFGNLKQGLGVVVVLDGGRTLDQLVVDSPGTGWAASVYAAPAPQATLADWGRPVATAADARPGTTRFELGGASGGAVLLWITDLGDGSPRVKLEIQELSVVGR